MALDVTIYEWNRDFDYGNFKAITREVLGRSMEERGVQDLYIWDQRGNLASPRKRSRDTFIVYINAFATRDVTTRPIPDRFWGFTHQFERRGIEHMFEPAGLGMLIIEPESGCAVAELIGNELYILFPVNNDRALNEQARHGIYRKILREALAFLGGSFPTLEELVSGDFADPDTNVMKQLRAELPNRRQALMKQVTHANALSDQLHSLKENTSEADRIVQMLYRIPEVQRLSIKDGDIVVLTHTMYGEHPETKNLHEFGEFEIRLTFGPHATARFKNITRKVYLDYDMRGNYGHPHVERADGYWCQGEGAGIIPLLRAFEFEAATLFALKAVDSVNESRVGNYLRVLALFPVVAKRMKYPAKKPDLDAPTREAFARIFRGTLDTTRAHLTEKIAGTREAVKPDQAKILQGTLAATLEKLLKHPAVKDVKRRNAPPTPAITVFVRSQVENIKALPGVYGVSIKEDVLEVVTDRLDTVDTASKKHYPTGPWTLRYDFGTGSISFTSRNPYFGQNRKKFQAPQLPGEGELPLGQLTSTLPELLGGLEFETVVVMSLEYLTSFNGALLPDVLGNLRQAA